MVYNTITFALLQIPVISAVVISYHKFLLYFRYYSEETGTFIEKFISLNTLMLIIATLCSRFHVGGYFIVLCLLFLRLDFGVVSVAKFYEKNPSVSQKNFPRLSDPNRRGMWSKAGKIVTE